MILYIGSNTSFMASDLHPDFAYSFEVAAENSVGRGPWSKSMTVTTPKRHDKPRPRDPESFEWVIWLYNLEMHGDNCGTLKPKKCSTST